MDLGDDAQHLANLQFASRQPEMGKSPRNDWSEECVGVICYYDSPPSISPDQSVAQLAKEFFSGPEDALDATRERWTEFETLCHEKTSSLNEDYQLYFDSDIAGLHAEYQRSQALSAKIEARFSGQGRSREGGGWER